MKIIEFFKKLFYKPSYIAVYVKGLDKKKEKERKKCLDLVKKNQEFKKIVFVELEEYPNFLLSKDLSGSKEKKNLRGVKIYEAKNGDIRELQSHMQDYPTYYGILKPLIIREAEPQVTAEKDAVSNDDEGRTGKVEDRSNESDVEQQPNVKDNGVAGVMQDDNINEEASDIEENISPREEDNAILAKIESLKTEILKLIEEKLKETTNKIDTNSKKIESITNTIVDEKKIEVIVNSIIKEEVKAYINASDLNTKLCGYVKKGDFITAKSSIEGNANKIENIDKKLNTIDSNKIDYGAYEKLCSEVKDIKESLNTILSVYQSSEAGKLQKELEDLESELNEAQGKLKKKEKALNDSKKENELIKIDNEKKKNRIESLEQDIAGQKKEFNEQKKKLNDTQKTLQKTSKALNAANEKIAEQEKAIKDSETIIETKNGIINKNEDELKEKGRKISEQTTRIDGLLQEKSQLEGDLCMQKNTNVELEKTIHDDNEKLKNDFLNALSAIKGVIEERGYIIPCGDNEGDCEELEDMLEVKVKKFANGLSKSIENSLKISSTINALTELVENELLNERSWIYDVARYRAYSRKRFMKDESREHGVRLEKDKIVVMWENLNKILSMLGFSLIMPDLFEDSVSDNDEYIDNTGQTISNLEFLIPNNDKYLTEMSNNDGKIIRDYAEIGYKYNGNVIKKTKVIR